MIRWSGAAAILALLAFVASACSSGERGKPGADETSRRTTASGPVVGFEGEYGNHAWLGIPYASAPVGELRWRAPRPPQAWTDTRVALKSGASCTQYVSPLGGGPAGPEGSVGGSDCLFHTCPPCSVLREIPPTFTGDRLMSFITVPRE